MFALPSCAFSTLEGMVDSPVVNATWIVNHVSTQNTTPKFFSVEVTFITVVSGLRLRRNAYRTPHRLEEPE
ncbi:hypothetical protein CEPID_01925 [Corynebacterium epidermidicanis]|uniref:Uncharacterized protein n=1 Tax=Corynebacterium epidermidicanis TaxID=1050174 RepID=A0A0G3GM29_9CORY|nr:hypothetical protein CEPID_01925 [Corynebacterium epidermidicanis]